MSNELPSSGELREGLRSTIDSLRAENAALRAEVEGLTAARDHASKSADDWATKANELREALRVSEEVVKAADFLRAAIFDDKPDASIQQAACDNLWKAIAVYKDVNTPAPAPQKPEGERCAVGPFHTEYGKVWEITSENEGHWIPCPKCAPASPKQEDK